MEENDQSERPGPQDNPGEKAVLQGSSPTLGSFAVCLPGCDDSGQPVAAMDFHFPSSGQGPYYVILFLCTTVCWV